MSVIQRPLFRAAGGGANKFPDLSGDGKVTQKDILMGRGVIEKQEGGGIGAMMPADAMAMMPADAMAMMPADAMAMMPEQMPAEAPLDPLAQDVLMAREEGEKIGLDYLAETMDGIDMAADTEELINSIRGNDRPLQDRVAELATYVGEQDAVQTPESVLAMVQPTIMMSEEGAIDSGVGGLIQQVIGETDMGAEMGQGVGALMAQGQPAPEMAPPPQMAQAPMAPPQQFAAGGPVVYMAEAGDPSKKQLVEQLARQTGVLSDLPAISGLGGYYDEYLPVYQNLISQSDENLNKDRALALAKAGFQFASGRDAKGKNIAGSGFLANLASAGEGLVGDIGALDREQRKLDQATKTMALQSAIASEKSDKETAAASNLAMFKAIKDLTIEEMKARRLFRNKYGVMPFTDQYGREQSRLFVEEGPEAGTVVFQGPTDVARQMLGNIQETQDAGGAASATTAAGTDTADAAPSSLEVPLDADEVGVAGIVFTQPQMLKAYAEDSFDAENLNKFTASLTNTFQPKQTESGIELATNLDPALAAAIVVRADNPNIGPAGIPPLLLQKARSLAFDPESGKQLPPETLESFFKGQLASNIPVFQPDFDPAAVYGTTAALGRVVAGVGEQIEENISFVTEDRSEASLNAPSARSKRDKIAIEGLLKELVPVFAREESTGRSLVALIQAAEEFVSDLKPRVGTTDAQALRAVVPVRKRLEQKYKTEQAKVDNPKLVASGALQNAQNELAKTKQLLDALIMIETRLKASFSSQPMTPLATSTPDSPVVSPAMDDIDKMYQGIQLQ